MLNLKKQYKGSILLITLLFIAVLGAVIFSILRPRISEIHSETSYIEGQVAYYIAEAGTEEGLFRYRQNKDVSYPPDGWQNSTQVMRRDLGDAQGNDEAIPSLINNPTPPTNKDHYIYDLRVFSRAQEVGEEINICNTRYSSGEDISGCEKLHKDEGKEFDLTGLAGENMTLYWSAHAFVDTQSAMLLDHNVSIEWRMTDINGIQAEQKGITPITQDRLTLPAISSSSIKLRLRPLIGRSSVASGVGLLATGKDNLAGYDDSFIFYHLLLTPGSSGYIDTGTTTIESTGYFGNTARRIVTKLNKQTGAILELYDFVLYSGSTSFDLRYR